MPDAKYTRFFWSDWIADTTHLDLMQHGAYMRLLEYVYQYERPIPGDMTKVFRILGARTDAEKDAIQSVLIEFFKRHEDPELGLVYRHHRAEREIAWVAEAMARQKERGEWALIREFVLSRDGGRCHYCGATHRSMHVDHVFPKSRGGSSDYSNLVTACSKCNMSKGARTPGEWLGERGDES